MGVDKSCLGKAVAPHIDSFNAVSEGLLELAVKNLEGRVVVDSDENKFGFWLENVQIGKPMLSDREKHSVERLVYPSECRERRICYQAIVTGRLCFQFNDGPISTVSKTLGNIPIMVRSNRCNLEKASIKKLVRRHENEDDAGGYFIVNGIEKIVRLLIVTRRNYPLAVFRPSFKSKAALFSPYGVTIRSVRDDQTAQILTLHYLQDESCRARFVYRKREYIVPVILILKALKETNDMEIYDSIIQNNRKDTLFTERIEMMVREFHHFGLYTCRQCLEFLGAKFRAVFQNVETLNHEQVGKVFLRSVVLVHLESNMDKFNILVFMLRKLYHLVGGSVSPDNLDSPMNHELLLSGHLYNGLLKEKLDEMLSMVKANVEKAVKKEGLTAARRDFEKLLGRLRPNIGNRIEHFLATGNLAPAANLGLQQISGYTILAERLNFYRYISHFQSVHRGAFFTELKTTGIRKLLPEGWGFLCPVNTPDGSLCGLLNHLTHECQVTTRWEDVSENLIEYLGKLGVLAMQMGVAIPSNYLTIQLDGKIVGHCSVDEAKYVMKQLRTAKVSEPQYASLEIGFVPPSNGGLFPGLYLFTTPARMMRQVMQLESGQLEAIGTLEQVFMDIAIRKKEIYPGLTTHLEQAPTHMLSVVANLVPFSDLNPSPRNMYQCQMAKQSMGMPLYNFPYRFDNKLYRLNAGHRPIVRTRAHEEYNMDRYPIGTDSIVAVISYTGYDMEDAMILNKDSDERGFSHGTIYKTEVCELHDKSRLEEVSSFGCTNNRVLEKGLLEMDGFPFVGQKIRPNEPLFSVYNEVTGKTRIKKYRGLEEAYVDGVALLGRDDKDGPAEQASVRLRVPRNPTIGDKFSARHGQKGICSRKLPAVDMPFSENGIVPDVIINPHAFPSRMTIGMVVESLAGKAGALCGTFQDATPFGLETQMASSCFGEQLRQAGYNYYGNEAMYSGIFGVEMKADIYIGVVHYQRLRHMVDDKYQVRTTGPVHNLTRQPVKGRRNDGGIRFGEMERDSLLAHGTSFLLQDRLFNCSDYTQMPICIRCGEILSLVELEQDDGLSGVVCRQCMSGDHVRMIALPFVFRYLAAELFAMNIKVSINVAVQ